MTPRSLFIIILKVVGLFFVKDLLVSLGQLLASLVYTAKTGLAVENIKSTLISFGFLILYGIVAYLLIFVTGPIIDRLGLDKGFDQNEFHFNIKRPIILSVAIVIFGGLIIVDEVPNLSGHIFSFVQIKNISYRGSDVNLFYSVSSVVKIAIGLLLIARQRSIVHFIERYSQM